MDAHHHLYDLRANYYPWLCDVPPPVWPFGDIARIRRSFGVADYLTAMARLNIGKSVHVEVGWDPRDPVGETRWLQQVADQHGFPHAIVGFARLEQPDAAAILEAHASFANFRGIRQNLNWHHEPAWRGADRPDYLTDPAWRRGFARLRPLGLSFDLQIYHPQMADAHALAMRFPDTRIILNHAGMPLARDARSLADWGAAMARLARAPNVAVKISGLGLGQPDWSAEAIRPIVLRVIDCFGPRRCMFASDFPVDGLVCDYAAIFAAFDEICASFTTDECTAMFAGNAERWYRI